MEAMIKFRCFVFLSFFFKWKPVSLVCYFVHRVEFVDMIWLVDYSVFVHVWCHVIITVKSIDQATLFNGKRTNYTHTHA